MVFFHRIIWLEKNTRKEPPSPKQHARCTRNAQCTHRGFHKTKLNCIHRIRAVWRTSSIFTGHRGWLGEGRAAAEPQIGKPNGPQNDLLPFFENSLLPQKAFGAKVN